MRDDFKSGKWIAACQRCGFKFYNTQLRLEWTKLRVCSSCFDTRQPQDFVKGVAESKTPWSRKPIEVDVDIDYYDEE